MMTHNWIAHQNIEIIRYHAWIIHNDNVMSAAVHLQSCMCMYARHLYVTLNINSKRIDMFINQNL